MPEDSHKSCEQTLVPILLCVWINAKSLYGAGITQMLKQLFHNVGMLIEMKPW
jgi:hypothetical protein